MCAKISTEAFPSFLVSGADTATIQQMTVGDAPSDVHLYPLHVGEIFAFQNARSRQIPFALVHTICYYADGMALQPCKSARLPIQHSV